MAIYQYRGMQIFPWLLAILMLVGYQNANAQSYTLQCDGIGATIGHWSAPNFNVTAITGQSPIKASTSADNIFVPGFIGCTTGYASQPACPGDVNASVGESGVLGTNSQIEIPLFIDMSSVPSPHDKLGSFSGTLSWDPNLLAYVDHLGPSSGFIGALNTAHVAGGLLEFSGINPTGASGNIKLLDVTFDVIGREGERGILDLNFTDLLSAGTFRNLLPCLKTDDSSFTIDDDGLAVGICGDVDNDTTASSSDALLVLSYDAGIEIPEEVEEKINLGCGDVDGDGATTSSDALIILSYDAGIPVPFPVGNAGSCSSSKN